MRTTPEQVLVTAGAQQGIDLCASLALRPGDCVLVESPTYPGAADAFARHGARMATIPFDSHWTHPSALREVVRQHAPRLLYLMPGMHNPTGRILPDGRRRELARLADEHELYVIEDNTLADVAFQPHDRPVVAAYSTGSHVLTLGSLSKSAWGGLRIGWVRGDRALISRLTRSKAAKDLSLSPLPQVVARNTLEQFESVIALRRAQVSTRCAFLQEQLASGLPSWQVNAPEGGLSLWVRLPYGDSDEFAHVALRAGVAVTPGSAHCVDGSGSQHLRLAFTEPEAVLKQGVSRLQAAWSHFGSRLSGPAGNDGARCAVVELRPQSARAG